MHSHTHNHKQNNKQRNIAIAFLLNLAFSIIELIGAMLTNSVAIFADAIHDLGDSIALGIAYLFELFANKKPERFTYGLKRLSLLSSFILGLILLLSSLWIIKESISRLLAPQPVLSQGMFVLALIGIAFNSYGFYITSRGKSLNERVVSLHLLEDILGWVSILIVSVAIYFTNLYYLDALLSLIFVVFILYNVLKNIKESLFLFLQATPKQINLEELKSLILSIKEVKEVHDLHVWSLDGEKTILTAHIVASHPNEQLREKIKFLLRSKNIDHITIELEQNKEQCKEYHDNY